MNKRVDNNSAYFSFRLAASPDACTALPHNRGRDLLFIENLCYETQYLPTMRAAVEEVPALADIPVYPSYILDGDLGRYSKAGIEIGFSFRDGATARDKFEIQLATLPHEVRHGYQDRVESFNCACDPKLTNDLENHIKVQRYIEADATVFGLAVVYELYLDGKGGALDWAGKVDGPSADAYWKTARGDEEAHWDGRAAQAAFAAYFTHGNRRRLKNYDVNLCREFMRGNQTSEHPAEKISVRDRDDLLHDYLSPLKCMPFKDSYGHMIDRPYYRPLRCNRIMDFLEPNVREYIARARDTNFSTSPPRP